MLALCATAERDGTQTPLVEQKFLGKNRIKRKPLFSQITSSSLKNYITIILSRKKEVTAKMVTMCYLGKAKRGYSEQLGYSVGSNIFKTPRAYELYFEGYILLL